MTRAPISLRLAAVALFATIALPIAAQHPVIVEGQESDDGYNQERISFADLNLTTEAGAKALHERIMIASGRACEGIDRWYGKGMPISWGHCRHVTYDAVKPRVDAVIARAKAGRQTAISLAVSVPAKSR
jgi:UrcA family protein